LEVAQVEQQAERQRGSERVLVLVSELELVLVLVRWAAGWLVGWVAELAARWVEQARHWAERLRSSAGRVVRSWLAGPCQQAQSAEHRQLSRVRRRPGWQAQLRQQSEQRPQ
jgi:hypothetical protein